MKRVAAEHGHETAVDEAQEASGAAAEQREKGGGGAWPRKAVGEAQELGGAAAKQMNERWRRSLATEKLWARPRSRAEPRPNKENCWAEPKAGRSPGVLT